MGELQRDVKILLEENPLSWFCQVISAVSFVSPRKTAASFIK